MSESNPPGKRRFYQNVLDAYRLTKRTYPALPWMLLGTAAAVIAVFMLVAWLTNMSFIGWLVVGIMGSFTAALLLLSILTRRALYAQVEDTAGAVKVALSQIQRGWVIPEQPVAYTREQDLVWRIVGRAGVVLISEGPASRVRPLLQAETKRVTKVMRNVPVHQIQVGHDDGQIALKDLQRELRKLKNVLTPEEVPQVSHSEGHRPPARQADTPRTSRQLNLTSGQAPCACPLAYPRSETHSTCIVCTWLHIQYTRSLESRIPRNIIMHTKKLLATLTLASTATAMAACADPTTSTSTADTTTGTATSTTSHYDVSSIPTVDEIAALVPDDIKKRGTLRNGASTGYAPAEYMDADGQTPIGYDIDINKALAKVMGLNTGETKHSEFPTIIPALGKKFDVGISSFTISSVGVQQVNMVSFLYVGSAWGVAAGNPKNFDASNPCGATIAVQTGTAQEEYAAALSDECVAAGKDKITVMPHELQTDIATKLIGGQYDATLADSTVIGYTSSQSAGKIEQLGDTFESAPQGVAVAKDDAQLAEAVQKAMQYLMDNGYLNDILASYGAENAALTTATLNPTVD